MGLLQVLAKLTYCILMQSLAKDAIRGIFYDLRKTSQGSRGYAGSSRTPPRKEGRSSQGRQTKLLRFQNFVIAAPLHSTHLVGFAAHWHADLQHAGDAAHQFVRALAVSLPGQGSNTTSLE